MIFKHIVKIKTNGRNRLKIRMNISISVGCLVKNKIFKNVLTGCVNANLSPSNMQMWMIFLLFIEGQHRYTEVHT